MGRPCWRAGWPDAPPSMPSDDASAHPCANSSFKYPPHGHRWRAPDGTFTDSAVLGPSTTLTVEGREDNPGAWLYHCHGVNHMLGGRIGHYIVT